MNPLERWTIHFYLVEQKRLRDMALLNHTNIEHMVHYLGMNADGASPLPEKNILITPLAHRTIGGPELIS